MVVGFDDLRLDQQADAVEVGGHGELTQVEAQVVEAADAFVDAPAFVDGELLDPGQLGPQPVVGLEQALPGGQGVDLGIDEARGLQVEEVTGDVRLCDPQIHLPLTVGELIVELTGLRIDDVGGIGVGVAPEQGVRQRHIAPVEAHEVESGEEDGQGVDEAPGRVLGQGPREQGAVGQ